MPYYAKMMLEYRAKNEYKLVIVIVVKNADDTFSERTPVYFVIQASEYFLNLT